MEANLSQKPDKKKKDKQLNRYRYSAKLFKQGESSKGILQSQASKEGIDQDYILVDRSSLASYLTRTAVNFHKMQKGLYLNSR